MTSKDGLRTSANDLVDCRRVGKGAFGDVFRAQHRDWGTVAFKRLSPDELVPEEILSNLLREVEMQRSLRHRSIVSIMSVVLEPNNHGIIFGYEKYGNMAQFLRNYTVPWPWKLEMIYDVALGLNYLHTQKQPVIHKDVKVTNILIGDGFRAKISDFGLAEWKHFSSLRTNKPIQGTLTHVPPERLVDVSVQKTETTDIYSLGVTIWEILSEETPYPDCSGAEIKEAVIGGQRPAIKSVAQDAPQILLDIMKSSWSHEPSARPTCRKIIEELQDFKCSKEIIDAISGAKMSLAKQEQEQGQCSDSSSAVQVVSNGYGMEGVNHNLRDQQTNNCMPVQVNMSVEEMHLVPCRDRGIKNTNTTRIEQHRRGLTFEASPEELFNKIAFDNGSDGEGNTESIDGSMSNIGLNNDDCKPDERECAISYITSPIDSASASDVIMVIASNESQPNACASENLCVGDAQVRTESKNKNWKCHTFPAVRSKKELMDIRRENDERTEL